MYDLNQMQNITRIPSRVAAIVRGIQYSQLSHLQPPTLDRYGLDVPRPISHHSPCHSARMIAILALWRQGDFLELEAGIGL